MVFQLKKCNKLLQSSFDHGENPFVVVLLALFLPAVADDLG